MYTTWQSMLDNIPSTMSLLLSLAAASVPLIWTAQPGKIDSFAMLDWRLVGVLAGLEGNQSVLAVQAKRSIPSCSPDSINWFGESYMPCGIDKSDSTACRLAWQQLSPGAPQVVCNIGAATAQYVCRSCKPCCCLHSVEPP
jgi:hypothetical protein